jgi:hypothetical protein
MSAHFEIFARPLEANLSTSAVVSDIAELAGAELTSDAEHPDEYTGLHGRTVVEVFVNHGLESDDGMPFDDHPYMIRFRNLDHNSDTERQFMTETYDRFAQTSRYSIFATQDIQVVLSSAIQA